MSIKTIEFDQSARNYILQIFNKATDEEGYIVEKDNPTQRVLGTDGEGILINKFAGVTKGSDIFLRSDLASLIELVDKLK